MPAGIQSRLVRTSSRRWSTTVATGKSQSSRLVGNTYLDDPARRGSDGVLSLRPSPLLQSFQSRDARFESCAAVRIPPLSTLLPVLNVPHSQDGTRSYGT